MLRPELPLTPLLPPTEGVDPVEASWLKRVRLVHGSMSSSSALKLPLVVDAFTSLLLPLVLVVVLLLLLLLLALLSSISGTRDSKAELFSCGTTVLEEEIAAAR